METVGEILGKTFLCGIGLMLGAGVVLLAWDAVKGGWKRYGPGGRP